MKTISPDNKSITLVCFSAMTSTQKGKRWRQEITLSRSFYQAQSDNSISYSISVFLNEKIYYDDGINYIKL